MGWDGMGWDWLSKDRQTEVSTTSERRRALDEHLHQVSFWGGSLLHRMLNYYIPLTVIYRMNYGPTFGEGGVRSKHGLEFGLQIFVLDGRLKQRTDGLKPRKRAPRQLHVLDLHLVLLQVSLQVEYILSGIYCEIYILFVLLYTG